MKNRTPEEITRQIEGLKKMKTTIPERSHFGDENWAQIDAQLDILEDKAELDSFYNDEDSEEYEDGDNDIYFAAEEAEQWMNFEREEDLFE